MNFVVAADHPCLPGHFPDRPLVPGVVVLERVLDALQAQHGVLPALRLPQVKFLQPLLPGQTARVELERIEQARIEQAPADAAKAEPAPAPPLRWRFRVRRGEELLASGEIVAASAPPADARA
ncbi:hypothetical protein RDV84_08515 [Lysobacter yananisis]|uniref:ApeI dehydratase-like domain-containing protein n=1 Tax=Lysobacter yananisis TaxID=1003114 RepID=A0ABY9PES8_9GAMM|nr:hypothetical protein [Lysobacter yananisis]WMT04869.1 hypothetical protein RDV84_08515 [Lysobacter yananisis]